MSKETVYCCDWCGHRGDDDLEVFQGPFYPMNKCGRVILLNGPERCNEYDRHICRDCLELAPYRLLVQRMINGADDVEEVPR